MKTRIDAQLSPASCLAARSLLGISQAELARLAEISVSTVRRFEMGSAEPSAYAVEQVAGAFEREGIIFLASPIALER